MAKKELSDKYDQKAVKAYHEKLTNIIIRIPSKESCGVDYKEQINDVLKARADETGEKPISLNQYILDLIEQDSGISIPRGLKAMRKQKE